LSKYKEILLKHWGYPDFRAMQEDIIKSVADDNKDTLGLLPTGGGKSILFQVPALAKEGVCLVVTPLIALMKDQVENLKKRNISAVAIYSGMSSHEIDIALNNAVYGAYKFLYLSPERLATKLFLARVPDMKVNLVAIDEAHCISQWGYDFRPSYLNISAIREYLPNIPFLALTATATPQVADDIQEKLGFAEKNMFRKSFARSNLIYIVRQVDDKLKYLLKIAKTEKGTGIVYVRNRKKTVEIAKFLHENGVSADYYHAGVDSKLKDLKQQNWKDDKTRVIVSTNAFGMGIDKDDVRFVVHIDLPESPEAYFQEAGRGGRDEKIAYAVLLYNKTDKINTEKRLRASFPEISKIRQVYNSLCNYYEIPVGEGKNLVRAFNIRDFVTKFKLDTYTVHSSIKFLQSEGYIDFSENDFSPSKIFFSIERNDLYKFQVANSNLDTFIKMLLRTYSGSFSGYVGINEEYIAKKTNVKKEVVINYLQTLAAKEIIKYSKQSNTPFLIFTSERLDDKNLRLSKEKYKEKKDRYTNRVNAMLQYAESDSRCRSQMLLAYFGEKHTHKCGHCDVCKKKNEFGLTDYEFDTYKKSIIETLTEKPMLIQKLVDAVGNDEKKIIIVVRWLLDNDEIIYDDKKMVCLKK